MIVVEALVQKTDERTQETGTLLQEILANAADDEGHWDLPLEPALRQRMFQVTAGWSQCFACVAHAVNVIQQLVLYLHLSEVLLL